MGQGSGNIQTNNPSAQGQELPAAQAAQVLSDAGIGPDTPVDPDNGETFIDPALGNTTFWIGQLELPMGPTQYSPDGTHIVYAPTSYEVQNQIAAGSSNVPSLPSLSSLFSGSLSTLLIIAAVGLGGYFLLTTRGGGK